MTRIAQAARITLRGFDHRGVNHQSPIEDQVALVYQAARHFARVNGFVQTVHRGKPGVRGPMIMAQLVRSLFPELDSETFKTYNSIIYQALRRTDAAVCVHNPEHREGAKDNQMPEWFIADAMPDNLVVVALGLRKNSVATSNRPGGTFDENKFLTREEKKLLAEQVGEDQDPGEVTVSRKSPKLTPERRARLADHLKPYHQQAQAQHAEYTRLILEEIETNPVPLSAPDLGTIIPASGLDIHLSTIREIVRELEAAGKIVSRKETPDEALVRGGGEKPRATRPYLFWPAPGPVPTRTRLPDGVKPNVSAGEFARQKKAADAALHDGIVRVLETTGIRTPNLIREELDGGYTHEQVLAGLEKLQAEGLVYQDRNGRRWFLESRRRVRDEVVEPEPQATLEPDPDPEPAPTPTPTPQPEAVKPVTGGTNPYLDQLLEYGRTLVDAQANAGATARIKELETELAKAKETIGHLRAAVASMG